MPHPLHYALIELAEFLSEMPEDEAEIVSQRLHDDLHTDNPTLSNLLVLCMEGKRAETAIINLGLLDE